MNSIAFSCRPHPEVVFTRVSDAEGILLSLTTKRYYSLNETGVRIWESLEESGAPADLVEALVAEYEVMREEAAELVARFVESLQREGLLIGPDPAASP